MFKNALQHWGHWLLHLAAAVGLGVVLLPWLRDETGYVHGLLKDRPSWQHAPIIFGLSLLLAAVLFKLFSPRPTHLRHFVRHPPTWLAWLVSVAIVGVLDVNEMLSSKAEDSFSYEEWLGYAGGAVVAIYVYRRMMAPTSEPVSRGPTPPVPTSKSKEVDWASLQSWLQSDAPADHDFLGSYAVASRLKALLDTGTQSIGIVGAFGAGKTSIVKWLIDQINAEPKNKTSELLISEHSCWGFETSAMSIRAMLAGAIAKVEERVDTFYVSSLPESYRETFSVGGEWFDKISNLLFGNRDPIDQFEKLSELLGDTGSRLILVVEDLDRNDSRSFDIQEVLAFLQQLKRYPNLCFILTGGLNAPARIDFAKLCDHIEYMRILAVGESCRLATALREHCLHQSNFRHEVISDMSDNPWNPMRWILVASQDAIRPDEALDRLCTTPRSLRHALARTYRVWQALYGEVDYDHLFALNLLRHSAPEAVTFMLRHWQRLSATSSDQSTRKEQFEKARKRLLKEWDSLTDGVEWDAGAAKTLVEFCLPVAEEWLDGQRSIAQPKSQGIQYERYWMRAVNETIGASEVRDQTVIHDLKQWIVTPAGDAKLVESLCASEEYSNVWEDLAYRYLRDDSARTLRLCGQVLDHICLSHGAQASEDSQGFIAVWRFANRYVERNAASRAWLEERIREASKVSLALVSGLWHYWGGNHRSILRPEDMVEVRAFLESELRKQLLSAESLERVLHPKFPYVFYHLIFDSGDDQHGSVGPASWNWLSRILLESLRHGNSTVALGICNLVVARDGRSRLEPSSADTALLRAFFGEETDTVIDLIDRLADTVGTGDQMFVRDIVRSARTELNSSSPVPPANN